MEIDGIAFDAFGTLFDLGDLESAFKQKVVPWTWHATAAGGFRPLPELVAAAGIDPERVTSLPPYEGVAEGIYPLAPRAFDTEPGRVLLVSGNEWDVAGAAQAGLRTAWLARGREPSWVMGVEPDLVVQEIAGLA